MYQRGFLLLFLVLVQFVFFCKTTSASKLDEGTSPNVAGQTNTDKKHEENAQRDNNNKGINSNHGNKQHVSESGAEIEDEFEDISESNENTINTKDLSGKRKQVLENKKINTKSMKDVIWGNETENCVSKEVYGNDTTVHISVTAPTDNQYITGIFAIRKQPEGVDWCKPLMGKAKKWKTAKELCRLAARATFTFFSAYRIGFYKSVLLMFSTVIEKVCNTVYDVVVCYNDLPASS